MKVENHWSKDKGGIFKCRGLHRGTNMRLAEDIREAHTEPFLWATNILVASNCIPSLRAKGNNIGKQQTQRW